MKFNCIDYASNKQEKELIKIVVDETTAIFCCYLYLFIKVKDIDSKSLSYLISSTYMLQIIAKFSLCRM
jgi:hypothetical protein